MSAGRFEISKYQATYSAAAVHPIRLQPETLAASIGGTVNNPPAGAVTNPIQARSTGGRRSLGLLARYVVLRAPSDAPPAGYLPGGTTRIPALTPAFYALAIKGADCSYLGSTFTVVSRGRERVDGSDGG